jgi:hypothetical protein
VDAGDPISYLVLSEGTPVIAGDGASVGRVQHVLADPEADVFDGLVIRMDDGGHRFADATQVAAIHEGAVTLTLDGEGAGRLPEPAENPAAMSATPDDTAPDGLDDKLKRAWDYLSGNY